MPKIHSRGVVGFTPIGEYQISIESSVNKRKRGSRSLNKVGAVAGNRAAYFSRLKNVPECLSADDVESWWVKGQPALRG